MKSSLLTISLTLLLIIMYDKTVKCYGIETYKGKDGIVQDFNSP